MTVLDRRRPGDHQPGFMISPRAVLVVVPTLNEAGHIEACLNSLMVGDPFCQQVRFVVVDGGSRDPTGDIVRRLAQTRPNLRLIENPEKLQSAGINRAVSYCAEPGHLILVRCDAHAVYAPGYVRRVAETFVQQPEAASVVGVLDARGRGCFQRASAWVVDTPLGSGGSAHRGGRVSGWVDHGHHAGFRLQWYRRIGGYDPGFSHNEDAEYDHRLGLAGGRVWLDADLRSDYVMRPSPRALGLQYWRYGKGRARTVLKHRMRPRARQIAPALALLVQLACLITAVFWPASLPVSLLVPGLYLGVLAGVSLVAVARLGGLCGLWAGPALLILHMAWGGGFLWGLARHQRGTGILGGLT